MKFSKRVKVFGSAHRLGMSQTNIKTLSKRIVGTIATFGMLMVVVLTVLPAHAAVSTRVIAGTGPDGQLVNDIPATSAQFWNPSDVTTTSDGMTYIADTSHQQVRKIDSSGIIHAAFGTGTQDCDPVSSSQVWNPHALASDQAGNVYVSTDCGQVINFAPNNLVGTVIAGFFDTRMDF